LACHAGDGTEECACDRAVPCEHEDGCGEHPCFCASPAPRETTSRGLDLLWLTTPEALPARFLLVVPAAFSVEGASDAGRGLEANPQPTIVFPLLI
jgi:hypothetical protein